MATYARASVGPDMVAQSAQVLQSSSLRQQPHGKLVRCVPPSCQRLGLPASMAGKGKGCYQSPQARLSAPEAGPSVPMVPPPVEWMFNETAQRALRLVPNDEEEGEWGGEERRGAEGCSTSERLEGEGGWKQQGARVGRIGGPSFLASTLQSSSPPKQRQESNERDQFYVNVGDAIRTLREELPGLFYRKPTYNIYREDIVFRDRVNTFHGLDNYKLIFWALRFHGKIFFKAIWVDIQRIWQPTDKVIMVRWTVRGVPRVPWEAQGHFDGTSEYKLDKDGKIYEHKVDNVIMSQPPSYQPISVMDLVRAAGGRPTPSFFSGCESQDSTSLVQPNSWSLALVAEWERIAFNFKRASWVRFYWALKGTLAINGAYPAGV
eukprot:TRINITY_DN13155_c0_g1_i1.p1 TRINITY_DN13155_c0_g1~~TRINITY_DN13155_c0_g1_i1.p1  ORF type:complete len:377 (-),score=70.53 TRINITY_DN13155_c0_g1_i1:260-1390(-)